jgi:SH3-like domain-containing protein
MISRYSILLGAHCLLLAWVAPAVAEMVSIKGENINIRAGAGTSHNVLYTAGSGFPLDVIKRTGEWLQVKDFEGDTGWVIKNATSSTPHMIVKANKDTGEQINVRSGPGNQEKVVAKAHYGVVFKTLEMKGEWIKVEHGKGVTGWVQRNLLWGF